MSRTALAAILAAALLALTCGGGSKQSSPTAPEPPVALDGNWAGTMTLQRSSGPAVTCNLSWNLSLLQEGFYIGGFSVTCPDGSFQNGQISAFHASGNASGQVVVNGVSLPATGNPHPALDGCSWGGQLTANGSRLSGPWQGGGCNGSKIRGGQVDLRKSG